MKAFWWSKWGQTGAALYMTDSGIHIDDFAPGGKVRPDYMDVETDGRVYRIDVQTREIKKLVIREDSTVLPEIPTLDYRFALGNLYQGTLTELVARYFDNGYAQFDRLCRTVYKEVMPTWTSPLIPWNEIVSERSESFAI